MPGFGRRPGTPSRASRAEAQLQGPSAPARAPPPIRLPLPGVPGTASTSTPGSIAAFLHSAVRPRRALFRGQFTRRPQPGLATSGGDALATSDSYAPAASPPSSSSAQPLSPRRRGLHAVEVLDVNSDDGNGDGDGDESDDSDCTDACGRHRIVVYDSMGDPVMRDPLVVMGLDAIEDDLELAEKKQTETERQRLGEAVRMQLTKPHIMDDNQPYAAELLETVRASLRQRVTCMSEEKWLFEPDFRESS